MLKGLLARLVGQELDEASAAIDVHQLRPAANPQGGHAPPLDFSQQGQLKGLPREINGDRLGVAVLAEEGGVKVVAAAEDDAV